MASLAPRVGKRLFTEGDTIQMAEALYPGVEIKVIEACKGADRRRPHLLMYPVKLHHSV